VAIRDAIAARDPERACAAMHEHLKRSHRRFAEDFGEQPVQDGLQAQRGRKSEREYKRAGTDRG
jgi:hypothetical protein